MYYYKFSCDAGYCGTDQIHYLESEEPLTEEEINEICNGHQQDAFDSYSYLATGWGEDFEDEQAEEDFREGCTCYCEEISEEEYREDWQRK